MKKFILLTLLSLSSAVFANDAALRELNMAKAKIDTAVAYTGDRALRNQLLDALDHIRNAETRLGLAREHAPTRSDEIRTRRLIQGRIYSCSADAASYSYPLQVALEEITSELQSKCGRNCRIEVEFRSALRACEIIGTAYRIGR